MTRSRAETSERPERSAAARRPASTGQGLSVSVTSQRRVADSIGSSPSMTTQRKRLEGVGGAPTIQREAGLDEELVGQGRFERDPAQREALPDDELMQGRFASTAAQRVSDSSADGGGGLPGPLRAGVESMSGLDMSDVQVHRGSSEPAKIDALAFARGNQIHLGPGQERHLPHEAWHVVQQRQGRVAPTAELDGGVAINDDVSLEREADVMGGRAARGRA